MKYSILHISDIHKSPDVPYDSLLQSLKRDMDHYTTNEGIPAPSFVVISGDLIQGAYSEEEIRNQYSEVESFLDCLCKQCLQDDRRRLIIVPGNHDVSRVATFASMRRSAGEYSSCIKEYFAGSFDLRWSWKENSFYEIVDKDTYCCRFNLFVEFFNRFFDGIREFPSNPEERAYVVVDDSQRVCFACFNSCYHLDHLCDTGSISPDALISVGDELTKCYNAGYLNVAVWHHHYYGRPLETNYMDRSFLSDLLSYDVHLGLFGHQHFAQVAEEYSDLLLLKDDTAQKLLLVSAGTLFGGSKELPPGCKRQYNLIEVDSGNGFADVDIHIREDCNQIIGNKIPHWRSKPLNNTSNKIHYPVKLRKLSGESLLLNVDRQLKIDGDYIAACEAIKQIEKETGESYGRIYKSYLKEVKDYDYVFNNIGKVRSVEDAILKIVAARQTQNPDYIKLVIEDKDIISLEDSFVNSQLESLKLQNR